VTEAQLADGMAVGRSVLGDARRELAIERASDGVPACNRAFAAADEAPGQCA
jgi:hypothetical protein